MARAYFADTWYFIALLDPRDRHHQNARRLDRLVEQVPVFTHEAVLTEVLTFFADTGPHSRQFATDFVRRALLRLRVISVDRPLFLRALALYERRLDKEYSLVDCISMIMMRDHGITHALTNDHHFEQEGFVLVNQ
jgi:predicted nucleic acid-binding protein